MFQNPEVQLGILRNYRSTNGFKFIDGYLYRASGKFAEGRDMFIPMIQEAGYQLVLAHRFSNFH